MLIVTVANLYSNKLTQIVGETSFDVIRHLKDTYAWAKGNTLEEMVNYIDRSQAFHAKLTEIVDAPVDPPSFMPFATHGDPGERALTLVHGDLSPQEIYHAALDEHPMVHHMAMQHHNMTQPLLQLVSVAQYGRDGQPPTKQREAALAHLSNNEALETDG